MLAFSAFSLEGLDWPEQPPNMTLIDERCEELIPDNKYPRNYYMNTLVMSPAIYHLILERRKTCAYLKIPLIFKSERIDCVLFSNTRAPSCNVSATAPSNQHRGNRVIS